MTAPFLLLHGLPTSGRLWRHVAPQLEALGHRVFAPDLPGFGDTPALHDLRLSAYRGWLQRYIQQHELQGAHLVGQDYGGLLAMCVAARSPTPPASLTLVSAPPSRVWGALRLTARRPLNLLLYRAFAGRLYLQSAVAADQARAFIQEFAEDPDMARRMEGIARGLERQELAGLREALVQRDLPVLGVWGDDDRVFPERLARRAFAKMPRGTLTVLTGARHGLPYDRADELVAELQRFIGQLSPTARSYTR